MSRRLILHIGTPKSGTTALHHCLTNTADELMANKISYPNLTGAGFGWLVHRGATSGNADVTFADFQWESNDVFSRLEWILSASLIASVRDNLIILSSEILNNLSQYDKFWEILNRFQIENQVSVEVVIYLRDPFSYFIACYKQSVKSSNFTGSLDEFVQSFANTPTSLSFFVQRNILHITELARKHGVTLRLFRFEAAKPNIQTHFFKNVLASELQNYKYVSEKFNVGLNVLETEFHRGLNSVSPRCAQLLGWERTDSLISKQVNRFEEFNYKFVLSLESRKSLEELFVEYKLNLSRVANFADEVDYSFDETKICLELSEVELNYRKQIFELGRFIGISWLGGYLRRAIDVGKTT